MYIVRNQVLCPCQYSLFLRQICSYISENRYSFDTAMYTAAFYEGLDMALQPYRLTLVNLGNATNRDLLVKPVMKYDFSTSETSTKWTPSLTPCLPPP